MLLLSYIFDHLEESNQIITMLTLLRVLRILRMTRLIRAVRFMNVFRCSAECDGTPSSKAGGVSGHGCTSTFRPFLRGPQTGYLINARCCSSALLPIFGEGSPTKIDYCTKCTLILTSALEDLEQVRICINPGRLV